MSFHASYSYRWCPVCVPCVSRLPPVSFYRYRYSYIPVLYASFTSSRSHTSSPRMTVLLLGLACATMTVPVPAPARKLTPLTDGLALGFDFGTSGVRCAVVNAAGEIVACPASYGWGNKERSQEASDWVAALHAQLDALPKEVRACVKRIAVSGTSSSMLLFDTETGMAAAGRGLPRMYDFSVSKQAAAGSGDGALELLKAHTPEGHTVRSATSALAKLLAYHLERPLQPSERLAHQADFVASMLTGSAPTSDWHNALKLGYDVQALQYPAWMSAGSPIGEAIGMALPPVVPPGEPISTVSPDVAARWGLPIECIVVGGTTDSIAAFLAAGATEVGDAVTSLGSTLAIKLLSATFAEDARRGVYSHRLGDLWLVGGASNAGCAVLREQAFDAGELESLSSAIDPSVPPPYTDYYPLSSSTVGERFPRPDPNAVGVLSPVPPERRDFLHCILHGLAVVEKQGYDALAELGASPLRRVLTSGGGAQNPQWTRLRQKMLSVPTSRAANIEAAYGAAMLACRGT